MNLLDSLLDAIVRLDGDALVMHVGEKPYVVTTSSSLSEHRGPLAWGQVELSSRVLTTDAVLGMLGQILPLEQRQALEAMGAIEHAIQSPAGMDERFTVVAARGGDDIWLEVRRRTKEEPLRTAEAEIIAVPPADVAVVAAAGQFVATPSRDEGVPELAVAAEHAYEPVTAPADIVEIREQTGEDRAAREPEEVYEIALDPETAKVKDAPVHAPTPQPAIAHSQSAPTDEEVDALLAAMRPSEQLDADGIEVASDDGEDAHEAEELLDLSPLAQPTTVTVPIYVPAAVQDPRETPARASDEEPREVPTRIPDEAVVAIEVTVAESPTVASVIEVSAESVAATAEPEPPVHLAAPAVATEPELLAEEPVAPIAEPVEEFTVTVEEAIGSSEPEVEVEIDVAHEPQSPSEVRQAQGARDGRARESRHGLPPTYRTRPQARFESHFESAQEQTDETRQPVSETQLEPPVVAFESEPLPVVELVAAQDERPPVTFEAGTESPPNEVPQVGVAPLDAQLQETAADVSKEAPEPVPLAREAAAHIQPEEGRPAMVVPISRSSVRHEPPPVQASPAALAPVEHILRIAAARGAATVYVVAQSKPMIRVDGEISALEGEPTFTTPDVERLVMDLAPARGRDVQAGPVEWMTDVPEVGRVRCVTFRDHRGPGMIFRMIPPRAISADQLGLPPEVLALCAQPDGLVLVTGARASGKSTLLSAFVDLINRTRSDHVICVESQINFVHEGRKSFVSQREVRGDAEAAAAAVRSAFREDPDVLVIEDLRTAEIVAVALEAAESGRLVLGSLSAPSTVAAIERLVELFSPERRAHVQTSLAGSLRGVVAQALLRKMRGGRIAAREVLLNTPAVASLILEGRTFQLPVALDAGRRHGMVPLTDSLAALVREGTVHVAEAYRKALDREALLAVLKRDGIDTSFAERLA